MGLRTRSCESRFGPAVRPWVVHRSSLPKGYYHKAKGREFDFIAMIVDPRGESSFSPIDEQRRLYYVYGTRAKQWLGVLFVVNHLGRVFGPVPAPLENLN